MFSPSRIAKTSLILSCTTFLDAAQPAELSAGDEGGSTSMEKLYLNTRSDVLEILAASPGSCPNWRNNSPRCTPADQCGKGWLFSSRNLLLAMPSLADDGDITTGEWYAGDARTVTIVGLKAEGGGEESDCSSHGLSILLRLQGPEALAEAAVPVEGRCAWSAEFRPSIEGLYTFDATLIDWGGDLDPHPEMCNEMAGQYPGGSVEMDYVGGVVFYGLWEACCSLCTRLKGCVGWSATNDPKKATVGGKKCVMYSSVSGPPVEDVALGGTIRSGTPRRDEEHAFMYLGLSMSVQRSWCATENARLLGSGKRLVVKARPPSLALGGSNNGGDDALPLCRPTDTVPPAGGGRWVGLGDIECGVQERSPGDAYWPRYNKDVFGVTKPEECFLQPDKARKDREQDGYSRAIADGYVWEPYNCRIPLMNEDARQTCLKEKNITRFLDFGDSMIQTSRQPRVQLWIPNAAVDKRAASTALEATVSKKEEGCPGVFFEEGAVDGDHGAAGAQMRFSYCANSGFATSPPTMIRDLIMSYKPDVVVANWAMIHKMWHHTFRSEIGEFFKDLGEVLDQMSKNGEFRPRYKFWLSSPFLVSEREPHCVLERGIKFNEGLRAVLKPRGWIEIDWATMTRKFSLDIVDGMHHGFPATRNLAYMLTHRICHDSDEDG